MKSFLILFFALLNLTACGGGDGGGNQKSDSPLTFTPNNIVATLEAGESGYFNVDVKLTTPFYGYIMVTEDTGTINPNIRITTNSSTSYTAGFGTPSTLPVGTHNGRIEVKLCNDANCESQITGSPTYIDFKIEVTSIINLTPLAVWPNINNWETFQSNSAHTGYVPVTLDVNAFSQRWRWVSSNEPQTQVSSAVVANGVLYFSHNNNLFALNEYDASEKWQRSFAGTLQPPAVSDDNIFVATTGHSDTFMWGFAADTGVEKFKSEFLSQWGTYYAPTVDSGVLYSSGGYYGGLNAFNTTDGAKLWHADTGYQDQLTPAIDANNAYMYNIDSIAGLKIVDKTTGSMTMIEDEYYDYDVLASGLRGAPVIGSEHSIFIVNNFGSAVNEDRTNHLISFDTEESDIKWALPGTFRTTPALAKGIIYATNRSPFQLEARNELSGDLLWTWTPPLPHYDSGTDFYGNIIVTDNIVFVSTDKQVYAIDINSHDEVWSYKKGGELALSNSGVLYINTTTPTIGRISDGAIVAINLK